MLRVSGSGECDIGLSRSEDIADIDMQSVIVTTQSDSRLKEAIDREDINSLSGLLRVKGVGDKTLQKLFDYIINTPKGQKTLFD